MKFALLLSVKMSSAHLMRERAPFVFRIITVVEGVNVARRERPLTIKRKKKKD